MKKKDSNLSTSACYRTAALKSDGMVAGVGIGTFLGAANQRAIWAMVMKESRTLLRKCFATALLGLATVVAPQSSVTINPVNDAPTIANIPSQSLLENTPLAVLFRINDPDSLFGDLIVTGTSSDQSLFPATGMVIHDQSLENIVRPGDPVIASSANSPGAEGVANAIDGTNAKYLNFDTHTGGTPSGFIVTPSVEKTLVTGLTLRSANDAPERDPKTVLLEGSNDSTISTFASGAWQTVATISNIPEWTARFETKSFFFANATVYTRYRFTVLETQGSANSMQIAEVGLLGTLQGVTPVGVDRLLTWTPALNSFGNATITLTINDGQALSSTSFPVTVNRDVLRVPGAFFIEAEDFDYGAGQYKAEADVMPYSGGAYLGFGAVQGVDYFGGSSDDPSADNYRTSENPNVGIAGSGDSNRGSFNLTSNFKVGWNNAGDWFNYTRTFPVGVYNGYARLASGGADEHAELGQVTSGVGTSSQAVVQLGHFDAPATGGWDTFAFVPLKDESGALTRLYLSGPTTVRFTVRPGNVDLNYLVFVPALPLAPVTPPQLLFASLLVESSQVALSFSEPLEAASALTFANYSLTGAAGITDISLSDNGKKVLLTVSGLSEASVSVQVSNIRNRGGNLIASGSQVIAAPAQLHGVDVGTAGDPVEPGATFPAGEGAFDVIAGGSDIWDKADHLHFAYEERVGDFDVQVQVIRLDTSDYSAKAGLMIRQDLTAGSPNAKIVVNPLAGEARCKAEFRAAQDLISGAWTAGNVAEASIPNTWLRLKRQGDVLTSYRSTDGMNWTFVGQLSQSFKDPVLVGLATTAHNNSPGQTTIAEYRNYVISVPAPLLTVASLDAIASEAGGDSGLFKFSISGDRSQPLTIAYSLGGTAQNGVDYETIPSAITIPAGQKSSVLPIYPLADALVEPYETVTVTLAPITGYETGNTTAMVAIFDDNPTPGFLKRERYLNISGTTIADLSNSGQFPNSADEIDVLSSLESPGWGDNYGQRLSGWLLPPITGNYLFYLASDDQSQLWLSTDENPAHRILLAYEPAWNGSRDWTGTDRRNPANPENRSAAIPLLAGQGYYFEVLHKEGEQGDQVAVAWQKPGDPVPQNGSAPITGEFLTLRISLSIASLNPAGVQSGGGAFTLIVNGAGFASGAKVFWNGAERVTTYLNGKQVTAAILASDIVSGAQIANATVIVANLGGETSNAAAFTIGSAAVEMAESAVVAAGATVVVSTAPVSGGTTPAGVTATINHSAGTDPVTVTAATYSSNPNAGTLFDSGAGFVDLQVAGAAPTDSMSADFYYPASISGAAETSLTLLYFNGTDWAAVAGSGDSAPAKDVTDNLDATVSGGRFSVLFDSTSTPPITGLGGTVFASTSVANFLDSAAPVPDLATLPVISGQCFATIGSTPTSTDAVTGRVIGLTAEPLTYTTPGIHVVTWTYNDGNGNRSTQTQTVIVKDTIAPQITVPANITIPCNLDLLVPVGFAVTATDNCDLAPVVVASPPSGSSFRVGITTVNCTATDASGNQSVLSFIVTRTPLGFTGFLSPLEGPDGTGGNHASPLRTFKLGSTIPVKFNASCDGSSVLAGIHRLQVTKYTTPTTHGTSMDGKAQDSASTENQFRLSGNQWVFNLDTVGTGMSTGIWQVRAVLSDGSQHTVWIELR